MKYRKYNYIYLPFYENTRKINYVYLLCLYSIAQKGNELIKNKIVFSSFRQLAETINTTLSEYQKKESNGIVSSSTLARMVKEEEYSKYFTFTDCGQYKQIVLYNDFSNYTNKERKPFVRLSPAIVSFLLEQQDKLLSQYLIYIVFYCCRSNNKTDFTAKQFLQASGYSIKANSYLSKLSEYNRMIQDRYIVSITVWRDQDKNMRNTYSLLNYDFSGKVVLLDQTEGISQQDNFVF